MKIFQIGFNKCGTKSLHHFFLQNGYSSVHWGGGKFDKVLKNNHNKGLKLCNGHDDILFWTDISHVIYHFETLAMQYPDSKFIYNTRPIEDWIRSRHGHFDRNSINKMIKKNGIDFGIDAYWKSDWILHKKRIFEFFGGVHKKRLLIFNIMKDGGKEIQEFLPELEFKNLSFPHEHKRFTRR